jgi:hypothetical protein
MRGTLRACLLLLLAPAAPAAIAAAPPAPPAPAIEAARDGIVRRYFRVHLTQ